MRLINPNDMVRALHADRVPPREVAAYGVLYALLVLTLLLPVIHSSSSLRIINMSLFVGLTFFEILAAYYINSRGDGKHFWQRYVSLCASQAALMTLVVLLAMMLLPLSLGAFGIPISTTGIVGIPEVAVLHTIGICFLIWLLVLVRQLATS